MPRFSEKEKEQIKIRLLTEGEHLFINYGLKKVTIDEIVSVVSIAKATFYTFFDSKESLYLDIVQKIQQSIFQELSILLESNGHLPNKQRVYQLFHKMYSLMLRYPILSQIDNDTVQMISRKVPKERLATFLSQNIDAVVLLEKHGIKFACSSETASCTFLALYHGWISLHDKDKAIQEAVSEILLNSVIEQIIV